MATSFASVKFLLMDGLIGSVLPMFMHDHANNLSQLLIGCSYIITLSKPLDELKAFRPTSSRIGPTTLVIHPRTADNQPHLYMLLHPHAVESSLVLSVLT